MDPSGDVDGMLRAAPPVRSRIRVHQLREDQPARGGQTKNGRPLEELSQIRMTIHAEGRIGGNELTPARAASENSGATAGIVSVKVDPLPD